eukprot:CAMPEP_0204612004 /NCGR_PEP_ID=MMETSP0717-20131115/98_1 /ASSEMBLY_ACC=CAM_ASM_000666 /TAXON_ID=230516 /ORGANISM="Chaetoceros curvisetus" /LENGTH=405 /DNA_ID=CAMNT_0051623891 /DNA_START=91 /DNA_END=1306 /DNA_ORIENTATION=-
MIKVIRILFFALTVKWLFIIQFLNSANAYQSFHLSRGPFSRVSTILHSSSSQINDGGSLDVEAKHSGKDKDLSTNSIRGGSNGSEPNHTPKRIRPRIPVLQYHDDWVCVNKPAGMTVHRSKNTSRRELVLSTLLKRQLARKVYPVHRLDHRTSGAILFAFDSKTCGLLHRVLTSSSSSNSNQDELVSSEIEADGDIQDSFEDRCSEEGGVSDKNYIALLKGDWRRKFGDKETITVDKPLKVKEVEKHARTEFRLLGSTSADDNVEFHPGACSLVLCTPKTGRTHQIRRHARYMGLPIIGDSAHGDSRVNRWWRENRGLNRLFLHCLSLDLPPLSTVDDSKSDERINCIAPLLPELVSVLESEEMADVWNAAIQKDDRLTIEIFDEGVEHLGGIIERLENLKTVLK